MRDWKEGRWEAQREEREGEKGCNYILIVKLYLKKNKQIKVSQEEVRNKLWKKNY